MQKRSRDRISSSLPGIRKRNPIQTETAAPSDEPLYLTRLPQLPVGDANLQVLPTELFSEVVQSLPPSSKLALSETCSYFRSYFLDSGFSIKTVFEDEDLRNTHTASSADQHRIGSIMDRRWDYLDCLHGLDGRMFGLLEKQWHFTNHLIRADASLLTERWAFLCMLDRDRLRDYVQKSDSKALCSCCRTIHIRDFFSPSQLQKDANERECRGSEGRLWICPHTSISSTLGQKRPSPWGVLGCDDLHHKVFIMWPTVILVRSVCVSREYSTISQADVANALRRLDYEICPHLRINDPSIPLLYDPRYTCMAATSDKFACVCKICCRPSQFEQCTTCNIKIGFRARKIPGTNNQRLLYLRIRRNIVPSSNPTDPVWLAQIVSPSRSQRLKQQWEACDVQVKGQLPSFMPEGSNVNILENWKIDTAELLRDCGS